MTDASAPPRARARLRAAAVAAVVLGFFAVALVARWQDVAAAKWRLAPGYFALACLFLAASYTLAAWLWATALRGRAGVKLASGARIWFLSNLARYVPGNVWSYVGAVELARREGAPRHATLAAMALTQGLSVGVALLAGAPVLVAQRAGLGRPALLGLGVLAALAAAVVLLRRPLLALVRRRYPQLDLRELVPSPRAAAWLALGYAAYWLVTGLAFAAFTRSLHSLPASDVPLLAAAFAAAYAVGFLSLLTPAGLGVRETVLVVALTAVMPAGAALVVALLSRVWMMAAELLGAAVTWRAGRHEGAAPG